METSFRFVAVFSIVVVIFMLCQAPQPTAAAAIVRRDTAAAARSSSNTNWKHPCGEDEETDADTDTDAEPDDSHDTTTISNARIFADLSDRVAALKRAISSLKNDYVAARFGDASSAEQSIDLNSPNSIAPNWNLTNANDSEILKLSYGNLARLAVLTNLTRQGEAASDRAPNFTDRFQELKDQPFRGLYIIMCELSNAMSRLGVAPMSAETETAIEAISLPTHSTEAQRHSRDYYVLRLLEISADKLIVFFDRFAGRTTTSR